MIPAHLFYQIYISFLEQNNCTPPKCGELSEYTDSAHTEVKIFLQDIWMGQMCMTDAGSTQDNFIVAASPVAGAPISQDWLHRTKFVRNRNIPIILLRGRKEGNVLFIDTLNTFYYCYMALDIW